MYLPNHRLLYLFTITLFLAGFHLTSKHILAGELNSKPYLKAAQTFANTILEYGKDTYGENHTPLFVDGLHAETLKPVIWKKDGKEWVLCNVASQQPLMRTLDALTTLTGDQKYRQAAEKANQYALKNLVSPSGMLYWGGHLAWDLREEKPVGQYDGIHEMKGHQPYYALMNRVNPEAAQKMLGAIWAGHILDWSRLDYNRHANVNKTKKPQWDHNYLSDIDVPFPAEGNNLSFVNVTPCLLHSGFSLALIDNNLDALKWSRRLAERWQQGKHPKTGLCGGQLSYREHDRAQDALGHVHPSINEAKIVASYHQTSRYHNLPLAQMQAAQKLITKDGEYKKAGKQLIDWAVEDLKIYAKHCYQEETGKFIAVMIDGTPLQWKKAKTGYYVPESFAPRSPDEYLFWGYAMAYRLQPDQDLRRMVCEIGEQLGLGDFNSLKNNKSIGSIQIENQDWCAIYGLLELYQATENKAYLHVASKIADHLLEKQSDTGLFPNSGRNYARSGDEVPLALLHLAAAIENRQDELPQPMFDRRFFHCEFHGDLEEHQQKRADKRTYDHLVFYGND